MGKGGFAVFQVVVFVLAVGALWFLWTAYGPEFVDYINDVLDN